jgi:hypothetical protein
MQDGVLLIPRGGPAVFRVRRSFERACTESLFPEIRPMKGFRDAVPASSNTSYSSSAMGTRTQFTVCALPVFAESSAARASASPFAG